MIFKQVWSKYNTIRRKFSSTNVKKLKYIQFTYKCDPYVQRIGCVVDCNEVVDLNAADPCLPLCMLDFIRCGPMLHNYVKCLLSKKKLPRVFIGNIFFRPPVQCMDKIFGVGLNYKDHCKAHDMKPPPVPMIFSKFSSTVIGPYDCIKVRTDVTEKVDYEAELCVVMGQVTSNVTAANIYDYVFGYTIGQDISARDWQKDKNGGQFLLGKSMDTFCPIGPCIVTTDEIENPESLDITCKVNDEERQKGNTKEHIHSIPKVISRLSTVMTLLPGDLILTGTPAGAGQYQNKFLRPGDVLYTEIEKIGYMRNVIVDYSPCTAANKG